MLVAGSTWEFVRAIVGEGGACGGFELELLIEGEKCKKLGDLGLSLGIWAERISAWPFFPGSRTWNL